MYERNLYHDCKKKHLLTDLILNETMIFGYITKLETFISPARDHGYCKINKTKYWVKCKMIYK